MVSMMAGSDFIKTSTGKESVNATLPVGLVMTRAIRDYLELTGYKVGFKPAGNVWMCISEVKSPKYTVVGIHSNTLLNHDCV